MQVLISAVLFTTWWTYASRMTFYYLQILAMKWHKVCAILDKFVKAVGKIGLRLHVDKTVMLTNEAQPPNTFVTKHGLMLKVLERNQGQRWLGYARMHLHRLWRYDAAHGSRLPHGTRYENYARKLLDIAGQNNFKTRIGSLGGGSTKL